MGVLIYFSITIALYFSLPWILSLVDDDGDDGELDGWTLIGVKLIVGLGWPLTLPILFLFLIITWVIEFTNKHDPPTWL